MSQFPHDEFAKNLFTKLTGLVTGVFKIIAVGRVKGAIVVNGPFVLIVVKLGRLISLNVVKRFSALLPLLKKTSGRIEMFSATPTLP